MISFIIAVCFIWVGFLLAISFMESWLKFKAPGMNLKIGLGVGMLVFKALNRIEWLCFVLILVSIALSGLLNERLVLLPIVIIAPILLLQTFSWLPKMRTRATKIRNGETPPPSKLHYYYVGTEFIKLMTLLYWGNVFLKQLIVFS